MLAALGVTLALEAGSGAEPGVEPPFEPALPLGPLAPPLILNGGFGDYRSNHFHAGLDLSTGGRVGRPVLAPLAGWIERVRASGVGYGRSLYLRADDGRLLVFGHLDAFAGDLAAFVAAAQDSSGQYEQDLWPAPGRFRVAAGERIAWSGESGAGGPHLHFEIRRGDMAYHPLRAGLTIADSLAPTLVSVTLEPLDDTSYVERSAAPVTVRLGVRPPRVRVVGRVRAVVAARDGVWRGVDRMVPWSLSMSDDGDEIECRFDSVSWATDMAESDLVYDAGRVVGEKGIVMWAPPRFRPRVLHSNAPDGEAAGVLTVRPGEPPRTLRLVARDLAGRVCERAMVLAPPPEGERGPDTTASSPGRAGRAGPGAFRFAPVGERWMRVEYAGAPAGSHGVRFEVSPRRARRHPASAAGGAWAAVLRMDGGLTGATVAGIDARGAPWRDSCRVTAVLADERGLRLAGPGQHFLWALPAGAVFEPGFVLCEWTADLPHPAELVAQGREGGVQPASVPLRKPALVRLRPAGPPERRVGLYRHDGEGWEYVRATLDAEGYLAGETRYLGHFALFADTVAPRVVLRPVAARARRGPYSRWALEVRVGEEGSGVDARGSWFEVDGRRVASEWDAEEGILRWRPARAPDRGAHRFVAIAADRAGNERRVPGRFVVK